MRAIDIRDLLEHPGATRTVHLDESVEGLHTELADVPADAPLAGDLQLESVVEGIFVTGSVGGRMTMRCARCLKEFERDFDVEMHELFVREAGPEDDYAIEPDLTLDPEPMVRDAVVLSMPFAPVCRPDCLGLCERCGGDRNLGECTCPPRVDPRWAGLVRFLHELDDPDHPDHPDDPGDRSPDRS
ncbi:MAG: DUF177 domain-containing protein [Candidatus Velamenicoccus archaeovorus]